MKTDAKKDAMIVARCPADMRDAWNKVAHETGQDSAVVLRELVASAIRYHSRNGNLYPPFELVPAARTPEEKITYTVTAPHSVVINGDNHGVVNHKPARKSK